MENIDTKDASGLLVPDVSEDSVDIYEGLDIGFSSDAEKSSPKSSQLKDSMDLYEELVTEEQQSKEASYLELKSRFQAAQLQIKELRRRVEQMEIQNTGLNTENYHLKKNISALLQTARQEVTRKDAEIQRLIQQSHKGFHHPQSHINNRRNPSSMSRISAGSSMSWPPPPNLPLPSLPSSPPPPASPPREDAPPRDPPPSSKRESKSCTSQPNASSRKSSSSSSTRHSEPGKHKSTHREEKYQSQNLFEPTDRRHRSCSDPDRSHKADKDTGRRHDSRSCKNRDYLNVEGRHKSDESRTPPPEIPHAAVSFDDKKGRSRERRPDAAKMSTPDYEHSAAHSSKQSHGRDHRKIQTSDKHVGRKKDGKDSSSHHRAERCSDSSKERGGKRLSKDYQRKEDRRREEDVSRKHKRSTPSETSREREKAKVSDQGRVEASSKEKQKKTHEASKRSTEEPNITEKCFVEDNSPNRKLCFMETLNLTLSPIKKQVLPANTTQAELPPVDKVVENWADDESLQPNVEDMCVIDELSSSELEPLFEDVTDAPKKPSSETTHKRCDDAKDVQEEAKKQSQSPAADEHREDRSVQSTSSHSLHPGAADNPLNVHLAATSAEISSLKARNYEDKIQQASDSQGNDCGSMEATDGDSDTSRCIYEPHTGNSSHKENPRNDIDQSVAITDPVMLDSSAERKCTNPKPSEQKSLPVDSEDAAASPIGGNPVAEDVTDKNENQQMSTTILSQDCQQGLLVSNSIHKKDGGHTQDGPKDAVSSTISLESLPQEGLSLAEAIYVLTQTNEDINDSSSICTEPSSSTGCIVVSKVSSTTEETALPEKYRNLTFTPKKSFTPCKSNSVEPSSSVPLLHDEDSMMLTLSNLKRIPDAISPLRSPIRITKRSLLHVHGKPGHVKSLQKEFSTTAVDANTKKLDVNKENKYPGSPANHDAQNLVDEVSDLPSSLSDTELEEGEIFSESDGEVADSPLPANKKAKLAQPVKHKSSPKSVLKRKSKERLVASKDTHETSGVATPSPKSRFKTVCPAATKASFSTIEEVMETFKMVRTEIRKKYMKLHKTFPKKSFYGVMFNFQESFLEFVDGAHFGQICSQSRELKSTLKKLIVSVFGKVSNNGIVKRIFEQQAVNLKQRLWDFVDVQVDYLFKDIYTTLKSLCKPAKAQAEDARPSGNEKVSRQPPAKRTPCQQPDAQSPPSSLKRIKPCAVAPYKTGLGSRGKDIRITHVEKDRSVDPHPTSCPHTQTVANHLPSKSIPSTPEKSNKSSLVVPQNVSLLEKTDFELLTEQQASSLTFNLVRDTQMGEIFKCLLQGSDLLESNGIAGDSTAWSLSTPRKDGERLLSITTPTKFNSPSKLLSPTKFATPSKLIATWSSISPRKMSSPRTKDQVLLNPALFDESCLLEVPSESSTVLQSSLASQRSYSILAEDLAVSLTIPSPLKSDGHLSFLQPSGMHHMSTPDSVISAHISEDALLDEEDASEQDIHLALDTDNSSCGSSSSQVLATPFLFKPNLPMHALVMEKSNDHFIVKIRQAATGANARLTAEESSGQILTEENDVDTKDSRAKAVLSDKSWNKTPLNAVQSKKSISGTNADIHLTQDESLTLNTKHPSRKKDLSTQQNTSKVCFPEDSQNLSESLKTTPSDKSLPNGAHFFGQISPATSREDIPATADEKASDSPHRAEEGTALSKAQERISCSETVVSDTSPHQPADSSETNHRSQVSASHDSDEMQVSERSLAIAEDAISSTPEREQKDCDKGRKRKKHQKSKAKRFRKEDEESREEDGERESKSSPASLSPNSLYAKNVIRKKGEVVLAWTRDEDRAILIDLKTKGASRDTFSALSEKLEKPSEQIADRFYQLMKLFKKQEKMDT